MIFTNTSVEILIAAAILLISYYKWSYQYWKRKNIPYLEPSFPLGNFKPPYKRKEPLGLEIADMYKIAKSNGWKHCGIYAMENPFYLVCDVEICKLVLTRDFNHFSDRGIYYNEKDDPISAHLFALGGTRWKNARAKLTPSFTVAKIRSMFSTLTACRVPLETFFAEEVAKGRPINMKLTTDKFAVDIIGSCAFGIECNSFDDPDSMFVQYGRKAFGNPFWRIVRDFIGLNYANLAKFVGLKVFESDISNFFFKIVEDTINYRRANNVTRADFLQTLIELMYNEKEYMNLADSKPFTLEETVSECFVFFLAGYETSSTTLTFALYELARHQDVQDKVRKEIFDVLHEEELTYDYLSELKYMQNVVNETLRLYPSVAFITRECIQDWKIPDTDAYIEKGTKIFVPIMGFHYDPKYFEEPDTFIPERFEIKDNIPSHAYMPFGEGPRTCIGQRFGLMEVKVGITSILRKYKVRVNKGTKDPLIFNKDGIVLQPAHPILLDFEKLE